MSDTAYMDAVAKGDMKTAQRMVDAAAKAAGYTVGPWYHGSTKEFTVFKEAKKSKRNEMLSFGFHFAEKKEFSLMYGSKLISAYLLTNRTLDADQVVSKNSKIGQWLSSFASKRVWFPSEGNFVTYIRNAIDSVSASKSKDAILNAGFDSIKYKAILSEPSFGGTKTVLETDAVIVFNPSQIKSSDPVTYDDSGNVIPLSQRFNSRSEEIRNPRSRTAPKQFPYLYAAYLKEHFPAVWAAGGNIRGNDAFRWWTAYRRGDCSPAVMYWWKTTRPAWIARHYGDYRLPGVIAQIKWGTVGNLGVAGMKRVVEDAVRRKL